MRILVCDDNRDSAITLAALMEVEKHETRVRHGGKECIESARYWRPHAVLLDIGLPEVDGYEVARTIRQMDFGQDVLLIAISGYGTATDIKRAYEAGFDMHLVKPPALDRLLDLISSRKIMRP